VLAAIRPEDLELYRAGDGPRQNTIRAAVEKVLYLGAECELLLRFEDNAYSLTVSRSLLSRFGSDLDLHLPAEHLRVWAEARPQAASLSSPVAEPVAIAATQ
jgi:TOBE domain-containing protein